MKRLQSTYFDSDEKGSILLKKSRNHGARKEKSRGPQRESKLGLMYST